MHRIFSARISDFLVPEKKVEGHQAEIPADLIAKAKAGHVTAQGTVFKLLHGDNKDTPIENAKTRAKFDALMKGEKPKGDTTPKDKPRDTGGKFVANGDTNNPLSSTSISGRNGQCRRSGRNRGDDESTWNKKGRSHRSGSWENHHRPAASRITGGSHGYKLMAYQKLARR